MSGQTARSWLQDHWEEYTDRPSRINACSQALGINKRTARKAHKALDDDPNLSDPIPNNYEYDKPEYKINPYKGFASCGLISTIPKTPEDLIKEIGLDTAIWEVYKTVCNFWGNHDTPNYQSKIWAKRLISEKEELFLDSVIDSMKQFVPKYPKILYNDFLNNQCMYELSLYDAHLGQLSWGKETGKDYDLEIGIAGLEQAGDYLLYQARNYNISEIIMPIGNDFFNVNNSMGTTAQGTVQDEDSRWFKVYKKSFEAVIRVIDKAQRIAPVRLLTIPGNHDEERIMYFAHALWAWYSDCPNVTVDIGPEPYKFYLFGQNLLGYTHGKNIKNDRLPLLMATEVPHLWSQAKYWEWHTGHVHHKNTSIYLPLQEFNGVRVRTLSALCERDSWHKLKGFGAMKEGTGLLWHKTEGNIAEFNCHINR